MVIAYVNHDSYHLFTLDIGPTENTLNSVLVGLIIGKFCTPNVMQETIIFIRSGLSHRLKQVHNMPHCSVRMCISTLMLN